MIKNKKYQEGDLVLCTVTRVEPTVVFVKIEENGKQSTEGTIITSEIAPGRIKNLREYVTPNKKIVCKVMRVKEDHIDLSLRRVSSGEKEAIMREHKKEKTSKNILKTILKERADEIIEKIEKTGKKISDFLDRAREDPKILKQFLKEQEIQVLSKILEKRKEKQTIIKKEFTIKSNASDGIEKIKKILRIPKPIEIKYLGSSKFNISLKSQDLKQADKKINQILDNIKKQAKKNECEFSLKEK